MRLRNDGVGGGDLHQGVLDDIYNAFAGYSAGAPPSREQQPPLPPAPALYYPGPAQPDPGPISGRTRAACNPDVKRRVHPSDEIEEGGQPTPDSKEGAITRKRRPDDDYGADSGGLVQAVTAGRNSKKRKTAETGGAGGQAVPDAIESDDSQPLFDTQSETQSDMDDEIEEEGGQYTAKDRINDEAWVSPTADSKEGAITSPPLGPELEFASPTPFPPHRGEQGFTPLQPVDGGVPGLPAQLDDVWPQKTPTLLAAHQEKLREVRSRLDVDKVKQSLESATRVMPDPASEPWSRQELVERCRALLDARQKVIDDVRGEEGGDAIAAEISYPFVFIRNDDYSTRCVSVQAFIDEFEHEGDVYVYRASACVRSISLLFLFLFFFAVSLPVTNPAHAC